MSEEEVTQVMRRIRQRIDVAESSCTKLRTEVEHVRTLAHTYSVFLTPTNTTYVRSSQAHPHVGPARYELMLEGVAETYYSDRYFPAFKVKVVDVATKEVARHANHWAVEIRLIDGRGDYVDNKLKPFSEKERTHYLTDGVVEISGLRFMEVSSKNGGHFCLEFKVKTPTPSSLSNDTIVSDHIFIKSSRSYNSIKGDLSRLSASHPVSMLPGIGPQYAQRLLDNPVHRIETISDLANLPFDKAGKATRQRILDAIRKDKGTMTEEKLAEAILNARSIVSGNEVESGDSDDDEGDDEDEEMKRSDEEGDGDGNEDDEDDEGEGVQKGKEKVLEKQPKTRTKKEATTPPTSPPPKAPTNGTGSSGGDSGSGDSGNAGSDGGAVEEKPTKVKQEDE